MALGGMSVSALAASPLAFLSGSGSHDRILVMIRLKGGNDGLNTLIPLYDYSKYQQLRPNLAIGSNDYFSLTDRHALPTVMSPLQSLWNEGKMKIVNGVGYPDHNLSHFESIDIWSSGDTTNSSPQSGVFGRYYTQTFPDYISNPSPIPPAIKIGGPDSILYYDQEGVDLSVNVASANELANIASSGSLYDVENILNQCYYGEQLEFLRTISNTTFRYADILSESFDKGSNNTAYPNNLGDQLALVARLIKGGLGTQLYMVTLDGFDTHVNQVNQHRNLMANLAESVASFYRDLENTEYADKVLSMTYSEFGRRVQQNASNGTDHGTAAPVLMFGSGLNGSGMVGDDPDLDDLDNTENLKFTTDFRSIYATVLEYWLCAEASSVDSVMNDTYERLDLGLACSPSTHTSIPIAQSLSFRAFQESSIFCIEVNLSRPEILKVEVFDILGQSLGLLHSGRLTAGKHTFSLPIGQYRTMAIVYQINSSHRRIAEQFVIRGW